jgi:hypothetical protein
MTRTTEELLIDAREAVRLGHSWQYAPPKVIVAVCEENTRLKKLVEELTERCFRQSELLSRKAERKP